MSPSVQLSAPAAFLKYLSFYHKTPPACSATRSLCMVTTAVCWSVTIYYTLAVGPDQQPNWPLQTPYTLAARSSIQLSSNKPARLAGVQEFATRSSGLQCNGSRPTCREWVPGAPGRERYSHKQTMQTWLITAPSAKCI